MTYVNPYTPKEPAKMDSPHFVCGTRKRIRKGPNNYRVVCATCDGGGTVRYSTPEQAASVAVRDSNRPCTCGAR